MELSERCIKTLENEGFTTVYEGQQIAGFVFELINMAGIMAIYVTEGSLLLPSNNETKQFLPGDRFDIPPSVSQLVTAGPAGCQYVIGEM